MELRNWVKDRFGDTDTQTLLDEDVYGRRELRKDKTKLEQELNQIESDMDGHSERYQKLLQKGANTEEFKQKQYAQKAKFEKKKYEVKKKKYKVKSIELGTIISIEGMREVVSMDNTAEYAIDEHVAEDLDTQELQAEIMDQMAEFGLEIEDMQQVQEALDIEIMDQDIDAEASEELEAMREMEAGELSREQVNIEEDVDLDQNEQDFDVTIDDSQSKL